MEGAEREACRAVSRRVGGAESKADRTGEVLRSSEEAPLAATEAAEEMDEVVTVVAADDEEKSRRLSLARAPSSSSSTPVRGGNDSNTDSIARGACWPSREAFVGGQQTSCGFARLTTPSALYHKLPRRVTLSTAAYQRTTLSSKTHGRPPPSLAVSIGADLLALSPPLSQSLPRHR